MRSIAFILALSVVSLSAYAAPITASFSDGNGNGSDGYLGSAGNGWTGPWETYANAAPAGDFWSNTITDTSPVNGIAGDKYLSFGLGHDATATGTKTGMLSRRWAAGVETSPYTATFDLRVDDNLMEVWGGTTNDKSKISISGNTIDTAGGTGRPTTTTGTTWQINARFNTVTPTPTGVMWAYANGNTTTEVDTGLTVGVGTTYHFVVDVDPGLFKYSFTISDGTSTYTSPAGLNFRALAAGEAKIYFGAESDFDHSGAVNFSLDNVAITVPEPASIASLSALGMMALLRYRKRVA